MRSYSIVLVLFTLIGSAQTGKFKTPYENGNQNQSATYTETIAFYKMLAAEFPTVRTEQAGLTDSGEPLHLVTFNPKKVFEFEKIRQSQSIVLINNGIHAGEPDGIDATMMLIRDLATGKVKAPENVAVCVIPVYNIGGALNRNSTTRVNQDGPEEYGFRGNARNYDLNRDFIKSDTKNTKSFVEIFQKTKPDVFIDNHVSNGADYQYVMTYIMTQHNRLGPELGDFLNQKFTPSLVANLKKRGVESTPYVNAWGTTPEKGFAQFFEHPRYATGYTALFGTIGFVVETHMLKAYPKRVKATYDFMVAALEETSIKSLEIKKARAHNAINYAAGNQYPILWEIDSAKAGQIEFLGYEATRKKSEATTGDRLFYDTKKPFKKNIPFFKEFKPVKTVTIPKAYVIPKGMWHVADLLRANGITLETIESDTIIEVESYRITDYKTSTNAYEGHYPHRNAKVETSRVKQRFLKGDHIANVAQPGVRYLLETLEPEAADSFFNWNFFDTILQQKEGYSDYVFEDLATDLLKKDKKLKAEFDQKLKNDQVFSTNPEAQLDWIYKHSPHYEPAHLRYPIYRILN